MGQKSTPTKKLHGDYGFREAAMGKCPHQIRREIEERARESIRRSIQVGAAMFRPDWPWLRGLGRQG